MAMLDNPARAGFLRELTDEFVLAQVLIRRTGPGFELRHVADRDASHDQLRVLDRTSLRSLSQFTAADAFRPLKSAPNLAHGWCFAATNDVELCDALDVLYPGAIADWFAAYKTTPVPVASYREFTGRQTGMYRITQMLTDEQVDQMVAAGCDRRFCLKQRLWEAPGLPLDSAAAKSAIPCLEPCAVLLEFARKAVRIEQEERLEVTLAPEELATIIIALEQEQSVETCGREGNFNDPANPRRRELLLAKLRPLVAQGTKPPAG
ncbi:MAG TPA: DR2241 family protein [Verrucomicrobiae bacterium]|nr:DR2241 family protein [Verrucomicrobiae bacterium]